MPYNLMPRSAGGVFMRTTLAITMCRAGGVPDRTGSAVIHGRWTVLHACGLSAEPVLAAFWPPDGAQRRLPQRGVAGVVEVDQVVVAALLGISVEQDPLEAEFGDASFQFGGVGFRGQAAVKVDL